MFSHVPDIPFSWSDIPRLIWDAYIECLWNYQPESWVGRIASTFRVLAVVVILPVVILTLLVRIDFAGCLLIRVTCSFIRQRSAVNLTNHSLLTFH